LDAIDACFRYARGELTREELNEYADAAYDAAYTAYDAAYDAAYTAYDAVYAAYDAARKESLKKSADICREILTKEVLKKYRNKI